MKVRAKFEVSKVAEIGYGGKRQEITELDVAASSEGHRVYRSTGAPVREITMNAVYDNGADPENLSFAQATPSGQITFYLNNAACADEFKPGDTYYVEFTRKES